MDGLQGMPVHHGRSLFFGGICSNVLSRNDYLSNSIYNFINGSSHYPILPAFRGTFRETSPRFPRRDAGDHDQTSNILMAYYFMRGLVRATADAPIARVQFLLQNQGELIKSGRLSTPYKGITDCFARIIKNEGVFSLWRGNSAQVFKIFSRQILETVFIVTFRNVVHNFKRDMGGIQNWIFGKPVAIAAVVASARLCIYPLEYARIRLASDIKCIETGGERQFRGVFDVLRKTLRSDGVRGIYRGFNIGYVGLIIDHQFYMSVQKDNPPKRISRERACFDLVVVPVVSYPCFTVSRRMMMTSGESFKYKSSIDAFAQIIQNEGIRSLYNGFGAYLLRAVPVIFLAVAWKKWSNRNGGLGASITVVIEPK
ncbi:Mitochondrial ADP/ATP carrier protein [Handroanthus impetiginosus]|uniref:ADP/ATP translocase n=1 Tax=Handroanthus impetiginosus TaxID=429701 RepID=A0A2G9HCC0_9LAMI|nr:Mitochondrial ADP/ATP carrier protein [Handroanthus impetiginosus]